MTTDLEVLFIVIPGLVLIGLSTNTDLSVNFQMGFELSIKRKEKRKEKKRKEETENRPKSLRVMLETGIFKSYLSMSLWSGIEGSRHPLSTRGKNVDRCLCKKTIRAWKMFQFNTDRAVFNWASKAISHLLLFCFSTLRDWLTSFRYFFNQWAANLNQSCLGRTRFPAFDTDYVYLLRILIGWLCRLGLFWLARVITLVLVLQRSNMDHTRGPTVSKRKS